MSSISTDFTSAVDGIDPLAGRCAAGTCMAMAEHLAHSPRLLLENIRGESVLAPIEDVYHSAVPFTGHHREYTLREAKYVLAQAGFEIVAGESFNYGFDTRSWFNRLKYAPAFLFGTWAEVLLLHCRKPRGAAAPA